MKLTLSQLESQLAKKIASIYVVSGDELILKQEATHLIRKAIKSAGFKERLRLTLDKGFDWEHLHTELHSTSLFAEKRLIELDFRDLLPPKSAGIILQEYANNPSPNTVLLIDMGKIDDKIAKSAWYTAFEKTGIVITLWPIPREQLPQWIMRRAKKYKLTITPDAAQSLSDFFEGNLIAAAQAIEKIYLLKPPEPITLDHIHTLLVDESRFTLFDLIDHLMAGNKSKTLHILNHLKTEGLEPILVLWGITRELRLLITLAQQLKQGLTYDTLFQKHRVFNRRQAAMRHFLAKTSVEDCWHQLRHAASIDKIIKGAIPGNAWEALQLFCLRLL